MTEDPHFIHGVEFKAAVLIGPPVCNEVKLDFEEWGFLVLVRLDPDGDYLQLVSIGVDEFHR